MNSLILLLGFFVFLLFGYATYGRWLYNSASSKKSLTTNNIREFSQILLAQIGNSSILFLIPAISICLFWGWVPALMWLIIAHIVCTLTFQLSRNIDTQSASDDVQFPDNLFTNCSEKLRPYIILLLQFSLIFLIAICINLAIEISTKNAGIFFALLILLPGYCMLLNANSATNKAIAATVAAACLALAVFLPTKLGIFIHGSWQPLGDLAPWLLINDKSILAILFVAGISLVSRLTQHHENLARFAGILISLLFVALLCALLFIQPETDAPINVSENNGPWFMQIFLLLLFPGIIAAFQVLFNNSATKQTNSRLFAQQSASLFDTLFAALLISLLAASIGLGAWTTHYASWPDNINISHHFGLGSLSLTEALSVLSIPEDLARAFISLCFAILIISISSRLLFKIKQLLPEKDASPITNLLPDGDSSMENHQQRGEHLVLAIGYSLTLSLLWHGLTLNIWLLFGIVNWLLISLFLLDLNLNLIIQKKRQDPLIFATGFILVIGLLQSLAQTVIWYINQQWFSAICSTIIIIAASPLLAHYILRLLPELGKNEEINIFDQ